MKLDGESVKTEEAAYLRKNINTRLSKILKGVGRQHTHEKAIRFDLGRLKNVCPHNFAKMSNKVQQVLSETENLN